MSGRIRRAGLVVALGVVAGVAMGCTDDSESDQPPGDEQSVDEVAASWGEISPRDEERTRTYLTGDGGPLMEYADFAASLPDRLDDAAYADGCAELRAEWEDGHSRRDVIEWLYELPDPILGRLLTSQLPTAELALDACSDGDRDESAELAEQVARVQELVDRRLEQLGVDR